MRYIITLLATATPALAEVPRVVTDIPPVHALVAQVMGDLGQPELLLAKGADEHDFQLKPSQAGAVADADLVFLATPVCTIAGLVQQMAPFLAPGCIVTDGGSVKEEIVVACEEAHRYIPQDERNAFGPTRRSIARIAKEGR